MIKRNTLFILSVVICTLLSLTATAQGKTYIAPTKKFCDDDEQSMAVKTLAQMLPTKTAFSAQTTVTHHQNNLPGFEGRRSGLILITPSKKMASAEDSEGEDEQTPQWEWHLTHVITAPYDRRGHSLSKNPPFHLSQLRPGLYLEKFGEHQVICSLSGEDSEKKLTLKIVKLENIEIEITGPYRIGHTQPWLPATLLFIDKDKSGANSYEISYEKWQKIGPENWVPLELVIQNLLAKNSSKSTTVTIRTRRMKTSPFPSELYEQFIDGDRKSLGERQLARWEEFLDQPFPPFPNVQDDEIL